MRWTRLLVIAVSWQTAASAQALDPAAAELLFGEGRKAVEAGDYATACPKFAESHRLDPAAGTVINLAECLDKQGRPSQAWQRWREALEMLRPGDDRRLTVERRIEALEQRLPRVTIRLRADAPEGTVIERNGVALGSAAFGLPLPVDPGKHVIVARAPGREEARYEVELAERATKTVEVGPGPALPGPSTSEKPAALTPPQPERPKDDGGFPFFPVGVAVGGVGLASAIAGGVFGVLAYGKKSEMEDHCVEGAGGRLVCDPAGVDAADQGRTFATVANIGVVAGVVGLGVGGYLLWRAGDEPESATLSMAQVAGGGALRLSGGF